MVDTHLDTTNTTTSTTNMDIESPPARAPLLDCNLCELTFDAAEERRQHAKSEWHVYKLRCKVAEPGTTITPPASPSSKLKPKSKSPSSNEESLASDSEESETEVEIEFIPEECLFCAHTSTDLASYISHMSQTHSLSIPFQSSLVVDIQTLLWFLHMVIFRYRECICCGKRKRSVEAVQAHMTATGHCRFDVTEEMAGFYDMDKLREVEMGSKPDEMTLRLPSGKLLGHRSHSDQNTNRRMREKSPGAQTLPSSGPSTSQALTTKKDRKDQTLSTQLAGLSTGDQMSLMHLPASQQKSLLVRHKKELDKAKRAERRKRSKLDRTGDKVAVHVNYYKQEVPIYSGG